VPKGMRGCQTKGTIYRAPTRKMPGFPTQTVGTPTNRGKARRYKREEDYEMARVQTGMAWVSMGGGEGNS